MWGTDTERIEFARLYTLYYGTSEERNPAKGIKIIKELAESGYPPAVFQLGLCYFDNLGVKRNYNESFRLYLQAAEEGYPSAQCGVGNYYAIANPKYDVCELSPQMALSWWLQAAEHGNSGAQCNLAGYYLSGTGVESDPNEAYVWGSMAVHCSNIRFRSAEVYRERAKELLDPKQLSEADERIAELKNILPYPWSDHMTYWGSLYKNQDLA
ncbi:MAG: sel1 repeat family protein [Gudongella sp.]|nr:sel1 repeat family protein [Gudongella sp.]